MQTVDRDTAIKKIMGMPQEQVAKILIFMAGMEAEHCINAGIKADQGARAGREVGRCEHFDGGNRKSGKAF